MIRVLIGFILWFLLKKGWSIISAPKNEIEEAPRYYDSLVEKGREKLNHKAVYSKMQSVSPSEFHENLIKLRKEFDENNK